MKVKSIAGCSQTNFGVLFEWQLKTGFTVIMPCYYFIKYLYSFEDSLICQCIVLICQSVCLL